MESLESINDRTNEKLESMKKMLEVIVYKAIEDRTDLDTINRISKILIGREASEKEYSRLFDYYNSSVKEGSRNNVESRRYALMKISRYYFDMFENKLPEEESK